MSLEERDMGTICIVSEGDCTHTVPAIQLANNGQTARWSGFPERSVELPMRMCADGGVIAL